MQHKIFLFFLIGLFANAFVNGGNVLCDIFQQTNPQEAAVELASRLDCTSEKGEDILRCLSTQTQQAIVTKQSDMFVSLIMFFASIAHMNISLFCEDLTKIINTYISFFSAILLIPKMVCTNCRWKGSSRFSRKTFDWRKVCQGTFDGWTDQRCWSLLLPIDYQHLQWWKLWRQLCRS